MSPGEGGEKSKKSVLALDDVYEIGFADGRRGSPMRETFMLRRWGAEQLRYYNNGYSDGMRESLLLERPYLWPVGPDSTLQEICDGSGPGGNVRD